MKAIKALSMPSLAPVVIVTSVLGSTSRPRNGEYAFAIAFFNLGRPYNEAKIVKLCWLLMTYCCWGILVAFDLI